MPRTKLSEEKYAENDFLREIRVKMGYYNIPHIQALALASGFSPQTLARRLADPKKLSLEELGRLHKVLHLDLYQVLPLIGKSQAEIRKEMKR